MGLPDRQMLIQTLLAFVEEQGIRPDPAYAVRASGVYAVLDTVYSSMAKFNEVVVPTLARFGSSSGLRDEPGLTFSQFTERLDGGTGQRPPTEVFERYAAEVMKNRMRLAGRSKVEVSYDVCRFFSQRGYETVADLQPLRGVPGTLERPRQPGELDRLVLQVMAQGTAETGKIRGIGMALGPYLLICLGMEEYVKLDTHVAKLLGEIWDWRPDPYRPEHFELVLDVVNVVALSMTPPTTAARLDNALWKYQSGGARQRLGGMTKKEPRGKDCT